VDGLAADAASVRALLGLAGGCRVGEKTEDTAQGRDPCPAPVSRCPPRGIIEHGQAVLVIDSMDAASHVLAGVALRAISGRRIRQQPDSTGVAPRGSSRHGLAEDAWTC
jgi:hypothetical protein